MASVLWEQTAADLPVPIRANRAPHNGTGARAVRRRHHQPGLFAADEPVLAETALEVEAPLWSEPEPLELPGERAWEGTGGAGHWFRDDDEFSREFPVLLDDLCETTYDTVA